MFVKLASSDPDFNPNPNPNPNANPNPNPPSSPQGHNAYAEDALLAHKMNVNPGGKQPKMRDTVWNGKRQCMQFEEGDTLLFDFDEYEAGLEITEDHELHGEAKGAKQVSLERELPIHCGRTKDGKQKYVRGCCVKPKKTEEELFDDEMLRAQGKAHLVTDKVKHSGSRAAPCCCAYALSQCEDFLNQKNAIEEVIAQAGHRCIFLPKYHPELNYIERIWGHIKRWLRDNCLYTMQGLWDNIDRALSESITPISLQRKFARKSWRWMSAYRKGLTPELTAFATRKYHGHRGISCTLDELVDELYQNRQKADAVKLEKMIEKERKARTQIQTGVWDPTQVSPGVFVGVWIKKTFEDHGEYEGQVVSHDVDVLGNVICRIRYLDGDEEDLFLNELVPYLRADEILLKL